MVPIGIAVVGAGPWGMTLAGALADLRQMEVRWICELDDVRRGQAGAAHPRARVTGDLEEALRDPDVAAVVVAVDPVRHHAVAMRALEADKHLFIEKPMTLSTCDARDLCAVAATRGRILTVGHLLLHHPAVRRARMLVASDVLGEPLTFVSKRATPGAPRQPGSAWWALAPHDVSLALHFLGGHPTSVTAVGNERDRTEGDSAATALLHFAGGQTAHIQVARFAPSKRREMTIIGPKATLTFDELAAPDQALRLWTPNDGTSILPVEQADALRTQCMDFAASVARGDARAGNGAHAVDVVAVLEAAHRSMRREGAPQRLAVETAAGATLEHASFEAA
jgi:predicted dehydrogenase